MTVITEYTAIPHIIAQLKGLSELEDAVITEDFTSPHVNRPVLKPVISVGTKSMEMNPVCRFGHRLSAVFRVTFIFPCGLEENGISNILYRVSAAFVGREIFHMYCESVNVKHCEFNSQLYGVKVELELNMKSTSNGVDTHAPADYEHYSIGDVSFDRMPEKVTVTRKRGEVAIRTHGRVITLEGSSSYAPEGGLFDALHSLMCSDIAFPITLPRCNDEISVLPESIETQSDISGLGFSYKLVFNEVL